MRDKGTCVAFNSEIKIEAKSKSRYVYPDAGVACPRLKESSNITGAITNPRVVVEVTSQQSEGYDRGAKLKYYTAIPTLREYVIIAQDEAWITVHRRDEAGQFLRLEASLESLADSLRLTSIGVSIPLSEIYLDVDLIGI